VTSTIRKENNMFFELEELKTLMNDIHEYDNFLCIEGEQSELDRMKKILQYDPRNLMEKYNEDDKKTFSFERLDGTSLRALSCSPKDEAENVERKVRDRKIGWGPSTDAYGVEEFPYEDALMFRFFTEECPPIPLLRLMSERFQLKFSLTYISEDGRVAGTEVWEDDEQIDSLRFEKEGYDAFLMHFLAEGVDVSDREYFITFQEDQDFYIADNGVERPAIVF